MKSTNNCCVHSFYYGGYSKAFYKVRNIWVIDIIFVEGAYAPIITRYANKIPAEYVLGIDSAQGKYILQLPNDNRPWDWKGFSGDAIANEVYFSGKVGGKNWRVKTLFPDEELGTFIKDVRRCLKQDGTKTNIAKGSERRSMGIGR